MKSVTEAENGEREGVNGRGWPARYRGRVEGQKSKNKEIHKSRTLICEKEYWPRQGGMENVGRCLCHAVDYTAV